MVTIAYHRLSDEVARGTLNSILNRLRLRREINEEIFGHFWKNWYRVYSAYTPNLPGCVATGRTREEAEKNIYEAIKFHLEGLELENEPTPQGEFESEIIVF